MLMRLNSAIYCARQTRLEFIRRAEIPRIKLMANACARVYYKRKLYLPGFYQLATRALQRADFTS